MSPPQSPVKASHSSLEMFTCSQKSPGEYPTAIIPALQKHPAEQLTWGGTVTQTANPLHPKNAELSDWIPSAQEQGPGHLPAQASVVVHEGSGFQLILALYRLLQLSHSPTED